MNCIVSAYTLHSVCTLHNDEKKWLGDFDDHTGNKDSYTKNENGIANGHSSLKEKLFQLLDNLKLLNWLFCTYTEI